MIAPSVQTTGTKFHGEAQNRALKWELWVISDAGRPLNPCDSIREAEALQQDLEAFRAEGQSGWLGSRIVEVTTTRKVVGEIFPRLLPQT